MDSCLIILFSVVSSDIAIDVPSGNDCILFSAGKFTHPIFGNISCMADPQTGNWKSDQFGYVSIDDWYILVYFGHDSFIWAIWKHSHYSLFETALFG